MAAPWQKFEKIPNPESIFIKQALFGFMPQWNSFRRLDCSWVLQNLQKCSRQRIPC